MRCGEGVLRLRVFVFCSSLLLALDCCFCFKNSATLLVLEQLPSFSQFMILRVCHCSCCAANQLLLKKPAAAAETKTEAAVAVRHPDCVVVFARDPV